MLRKLHPVLMVPAVIVLWIVGAIVVVFLASALNMPHINEHGSGLIVATGIVLGAIICSMVHIAVILRSRT